MAKHSVDSSPSASPSAQELLRWKNDVYDGVSEPTAPLPLPITLGKPIRLSSIPLLITRNHLVETSRLHSHALLGRKKMRFVYNSLFTDSTDI